MTANANCTTQNQFYCTMCNSCIPADLITTTKGLCINCDIAKYCGRAITRISKGRKLLRCKALNNNGRVCQRRRVQENHYCLQHLPKLTKHPDLQILLSLSDLKQCPALCGVITHGELCRLCNAKQNR